MLFLEFSNVKLVYGNVILLYGLSVSVVKRDDTKKKWSEETFGNLSFSSISVWWMHKKEIKIFKVVTTENILFLTC